MSGGGVLQLVAYGAQDIYLTGKPQITFWKSVYRRHTNFAIESILLNPDDSPTLDTRIEVTITRNGDLLKRIWLQINPNLIYPQSLNTVKLTTIANDFCHSLFREIQLTIGGQIIDRLYGVWLSIWRDLNEYNPYGSTGAIDKKGQRIITQSSSQYNRMAYTNSGISVSKETFDPSASSYLSLENSTTECYVPLPFWFCKNPGLALPLIALQYHEVKLILTISNFTNFATSVEGQVNNNSVFNISQSLKIYGDYVFLDTTERRQFAQNSHEYLIEQLQRKVSQNQNNIKLTFVNPVKEIIICGTSNNPYQIQEMIPENTSEDYNIATQLTAPSSAYGTAWLGVSLTYGVPVDPKKYYNKPWIYSSAGIGTPNPIVVSNRPYMYNFGGYNEELNDNISRTNVTMKLVINGKDQFSARNLKYFTRKTLWETHSGIGSGNWGKIAVIPFNMYPDEYQPSGCVNFSVISDVRIIFDKFDSTLQEKLNPLDIYALSYNILKITSGMGGVIFT